MSNQQTPPTSFIKQIIETDLASGKHSKIITRFPPEPNGFLHIGHSKAIHLNYSLAEQFGGEFHLRFDDTNPTTEDQRYIESIKTDVNWLGANFENHLYYASDYFPQLYEWAVELIKKGDAYVDSQSGEDIREGRGNIKEPGVNSPHRERTVEENLDLFEKMKDGYFEEGDCVLRAKIDMKSGNMNMRDPILYRILKRPHPRTGDKWKIYPTYDYAHGQSDSIEMISHSLCTLEFELHRPLYDWLQEKLGIYRTRQIESARMNVSHMVTSKRKLLSLVEEKKVWDWDDPRMPTLAGLRRRGYPAASILDFCSRIGVAKRQNLIKIDLLELCARECLHKLSPRRHAILQPLKVVLTNYDANKVEEFDLPNHPENNEMGTRKLKFSKEFYIDRSDFQEAAEKGFHRLTVGGEVRLRQAYIIRCEKVIKEGELIKELECTYDESSKGGKPSDGRKIKGTIHWVSIQDAIPIEFRMFGRLFTVPNPDEDVTLTQTDDSSATKSWKDFINPNSLTVYTGVGEVSIAESNEGAPLQFERVGFFTKDRDSTKELQVFNLTVDLASAIKEESDEKLAAQQEREKKAAERLARKTKKK